MKRLLILAALIAAGCTETIEMATVRIGIAGVETGAMTKTAEGARKALSETAPLIYPELTVQSTENASRTYTVAVGQEVTLPVGEYRVTASFAMQAIGTAGGCNVYDAPTYAVDDLITVTTETYSHTVEARYTCWALVIDYSVCAKYRQEGSGGWEDFAGMQSVSGHGIAYIDFAAEWAASPYRLLAVPRDAVNYEETQYNLINATGEGVLVEAGKWYSFLPGEVTAVSGSIAVSLPNWVQGN